MNSTFKILFAAFLATVPAYVWADPASILMVVGQFLVVKGVEAAIVYVGYALVAAGVIYGTTSKRRAAKKSAAQQRDAYNASLGDRGANYISGIPPWRIVYGRATVGGSIHAMFTTDKVSVVNGVTVTRKDALHYLVYVFAAHKCAQLHDVKIDGASAGPFDANGWSLNSEYRQTASRTTWGEVTLAPGQSHTADKPFVNFTAHEAGDIGNYSQGIYPADYSASITVSNGGMTATNSHATLTLTLSYTFFRDAESSFRFLWHSGDENQTVDTLLNSLFPDKWTSNHRIRGRAYGVVMVDVEDPKFQGGPPQITIDVTGRLVYDPRNSTTAASSNNALCIRDFLLSKWGANASSTEVNDTYASAAANACDVSISVKVPSYQDNLTSDFSATVDGWVGYRTTVDRIAGSPSYIYAQTTDVGGYVTKDGMSFSGATNRYVRFRIQRMAGEGWTGKLYYKTASHGYSEDYRKDLATGILLGGPQVEIVFDMHSLTFGQGDWKSNTITGLRFAFGAEVNDRFDIYWVKLSEFAEATETQAKYTLNGTFTTDDNREAILENMAASMNGFVTNSGSWLITAGSWTAPVRDFGDDDLDGQIGLVQCDVGLDELSNSAKGTYYPVGASSPTEFEQYKNATLVTADGEELWEDIALPFTDNETRARNIARGRVERTRSGQIISIPLKLHAWNLQVGDRIRQTSSEYGFNEKVYRISDWGFSLTGSVIVSAQEDAEEIYDEVDTTLSDPTPNTDLPNPNIVQRVETLAATSGTNELTLLSDGTVHARVKVTWAAARDAYLVSGSAYLDLTWRRIGKDPVGAWRTIRVPATATSAYIENVGEFDLLGIGARFVNSIGREGEQSYITHIVIGKTELPSDVAGLDATTSQGVVTVTWNTPGDLDYAATELRIGDSGWSSADMLFRGKANTTTFVVTAAGTYTLYAKHIDTSGNYSDDPASDFELIVEETDLFGSGVNAVVVDLSHPIHVFTASSAGVVSSYTGSGTEIKVRESATNLVYDGVGTADGTWTVSSTAVNITRGTLTDSGVYVTVGNHSAMADAEDSATITYTVTGKTVAGDAFSVSRVQSFAKAKSGSSSPSVYTATVYLQQAGTPTAPSGGSFDFETGVLTPPSGSPVWLVNKPSTTSTPTWACEFTFVTTTPETPVTAGTWTTPYIDAVAGGSGSGESVLVFEIYLANGSQPGTPSGGTYTFSSDTFVAPSGGWSRNMSTVTTTPVWRSVYRFATTTPTVAVTAGTWGTPTLFAQRGADGAAGAAAITAVLSNEAHVFPATTAGAVTSYVNSGTLLRVYEGGDELIYTPGSTASGRWDFTASATNITLGSVTDGGYYAVIGSHSGVADGTDASSITYTVIGKTVAGVDFTVSKTQSFSKSKTGSAGTSPNKYSTAYLYRWSPTQPGNPSGTSQYTWSSGAHSSYSGGESWLTVVDVNPGTSGMKLWVAKKEITDIATATTTTVSWSSGFSVYAVSTNGDEGEPGTKVASPTLYQWTGATGAPTIVGTNTYVWASQEITGTLPALWVPVPGTGNPGEVLWGATVNLLDSAGATSSPIDWTGAAVTMRGYAGSDGDQGVSAARAYTLTTAASLGSGTVTTIGTALPPSTSVFGSGLTWTGTPSTPAPGQVLYQSDGLYNATLDQTVWYTPYISALKVGQLSAIQVNTGGLNVDDSITIASTGNIRGGQTGYATGAGFFLGYSTGSYRFSIGNGGVGLLWNGTSLTMQDSTLAMGAFTGYSWPTSGAGMALSSAGGIRIGNSTLGFEITSSGNVYSGPVGGPYAFSIVAGNATFSGTVSASAGSIGGATINTADVRSTNYSAQVSGWMIRNSDGAIYAQAIRIYDPNGPRIFNTLAAGSNPVLQVGSNLRINADGTSTLGALTVGSSGHIKGGQTAYNSGTGFWLGLDGVVPKFSIGNPAGARMTWDGATLTVVGASVTTPVLETITASISSVSDPDTPGGGTGVGSATVSAVSGGRTPYTYQWVLSRASASSTATFWSSGDATASVAVSAIGNAGTVLGVNASCLITDANGRTLTKTIMVSFAWGNPV